MPAICESNSIGSKLSENLISTFKKSEKENYENHSAPTIKQVLTTKIEYEEVPNCINSTLNSLQGKYTVLKPNQQPLQLNGGKNFSLPLFIYKLMQIAVRSVFAMR
jgi:hypothetical protein